MARKTGGGGSSPRRKNSDELLWLETYFIAFPSKRRPTLSQVENALASADSRLLLENLAADDDGLFESLLVESPEDNAAVEVSYETGDAVIEQSLDWAKTLQKQLTPKQLQLLMTADARLDVAHFERVRSSQSGENASLPRQAHRPQNIADLEGEAPYGDNDDDQEGDFDADAGMEVFDPSCLLTVVETLSHLTRGIAFDPAAGEVV